MTRNNAYRVGTRHARSIIAVVRCLAYIGGAVAIVQAVGQFMKHRGRTDALPTQALLFGAGTLWTGMFLKQQRRPLSPLPLTRRIAQGAAGALLGSVAWGVLLAMGRALGSITIDTHANDTTPPRQITQTVIAASLTHGLVAWNEELVFRGYGFAVTEAALGRPAAAAITLTLFGLYHAWRWQVVLGEAALGTALLALRLRSGDMWLAVGYHWAWNVMQTGIVGPEDGPPAPLTLHTRGPYWLIGRPGHPEPGALSGLVNLSVAALALFWGRTRPRY